MSNTTIYSKNNILTITRSAELAKRSYLPTVQNVVVVRVSRRRDGCQNIHVQATPDVGGVYNGRGGYTIKLNSAGVPASGVLVIG